VGNVLRRRALPPAPERKRTTTWQAFIRTHLALLAGTDFFTAEVLTLRGLATYYVLFFINLESRRVDIAGITIHPDELWMKQIARNVTMEGCGVLRRPRIGVLPQPRFRSLAAFERRPTSRRACRALSERAGVRNPSHDEETHAPQQRNRAV
jgi:hypothetical protein